MSRSKDAAGGTGIATHYGAQATRDAMQRLREKGLVRHHGVSGLTASLPRDAAQAPGGKTSAAHGAVPISSPITNRGGSR